MELPRHSDQDFHAKADLGGVFTASPRINCSDGHLISAAHSMRRPHFPTRRYKLKCHHLILHKDLTHKYYYRAAFRGS